jgi:hypothetical protein
MPAAAPPRRPVARKKQPKRATSIRLSEEATRMLEELQEHLGLSQTAAIEFAIRAFYKRESGRTKPREKKPEGP